MSYSLGLRPSDRYSDEKRMSMNVRNLLLLCALSILSTTLALAQTDPDDIQPILSEPIQSQQVVTFQLQQFLLQKVPQLSVPKSAEQWTAEAQQIRQHVLNDVVFYGWPRN